MSQKPQDTTVLLVDDDVELLRAFTKVLEREGYRVIPHANAQNALADIQATGRKFDLVITDISMPGMRGLAFLTALKTAFPRVPVIIVTAFGDWGQYMNALREGAAEFLSKPIDKPQLLDAIRRALQNGAAVTA